MTYRLSSMDPRLRWPLVGSLVLHGVVLGRLFVEMPGSQPTPARLAVRIEPAAPIAPSPPTEISAPRPPPSAAVRPPIPPHVAPIAPAPAVASPPAAEPVARLAPPAREPRNADEYRMLVAFAARRIVAERAAGEPSRTAARVVVGVSLSAAGALDTLEVRGSSGDARADAAALALVGAALARSPPPAALLGRPIAVELTVLVE